MTIFEEKDCLSVVDKVEKIVIKEGKLQDAIYTFCIPTYKRSKDLKAALDSVFAQQTDIPFNVIVSDNCPERNDETESIISNCYSYKDNLYYFKNAENLGMAGNWNRLILECKTKYMIMLHDDDVLLPQYLERIAHFLYNIENIAILNVGKIRWDGHANHIKGQIRNKEDYYLFSKLSNYAFFFFGPPSGCLFDVEVAKRIGGFDNNVYPSIDYVFVQKIIMANEMVCKLKEKLMLYRVVGNTTRRPETQKMWLNIDYAIKNELAERLNVPKWMNKIVTFFELSLRVKGVCESEKGFSFHGYTNKGKVFLLFFHLYRFLYSLYYIYPCIHRIKK